MHYGIMNQRSAKKTIMLIASLLVAAAGIAQQVRSISTSSFDQQYTQSNDDGTLRSLVTKGSGVITVMFYSCHDNGQLASVKAFCNGKPRGTWWLFSPHGVAHSMANFYNGQKTGTWIV